MKLLAALVLALSLVGGFACVDPDDLESSESAETVAAFSGSLGTYVCSPGPNPPGNGTFWEMFDAVGVEKFPAPCPQGQSSCFAWRGKTTEISTPIGANAASIRCNGGAGFALLWSAQWSVWYNAGAISCTQYGHEKNKPNGTPASFTLNQADWQYSPGGQVVRFTVPDGGYAASPIGRCGRLTFATSVASP